ncbi:MAG: hypothetical protein HC867_02380 [Bacteroidia bacterium]|nr:hypothetical protein [Bacteroidia bacterium]
MNHSLSILRLAISSLLILLFPVFLWSQTCEVLNENLKGKYDGECKKGKAHGHGKATGKDAYEGDFKSGLPDGKGTYTWSNGTSFTGKWDNGLREGKGIMTYKTGKGEDSLISGFWKKDVYIGEHEHPYEIYTKTRAITGAEVEYSPDNLYKVSISITNTTGGVRTTGGASLPQMRITDLQVLKGNFSRSVDNNSHYKMTQRMLMDVQFPFRAKILIGTEEVEIELREKGSYNVDIRINL